MASPTPTHPPFSKVKSESLPLPHLPSSSLHTPSVFRSGIQEEWGNGEHLPWKRKWDVSWKGKKMGLTVISAVCTISFLNELVWFPAVEGRGRHHKFESLASLSGLPIPNLTNSHSLIMEEHKIKILKILKYWSSEPCSYLKFINTSNTTWPSLANETSLSV